MTDREKLDEIINLINKYNQSDSVHRKGYGQVLQLMFTRYPFDRRDYQPSGRPCYDKPAGVPILHGETVKDNSNHIIDEMRYITLGRTRL